jgi:hypothetical protein
MNHVSENPIERLQLIAGTILQPWKDYLQLRQKVSEMVAGDELRSWSDKARCTLLDSWSRMMKLQDTWITTYDTVHKSLKGFQEILFQMVQDTQSELRALDIGAEMGKRKGAKHVPRTNKTVSSILHKFLSTNRKVKMKTMHNA